MMNDSELEQRLQRHYQNRYELSPDHTTFWERLAPHLNDQEKGKRWRMRPLKDVVQLYKLRPVTSAPSRKREHTIRVALIAALVLCVLVFATNVSASVLPTLDGLLKDLGIQKLQYADLQQSKTVDGYTLTLSKAYADANLVVIAYTVAAPRGASGLGRFDMIGAKLITEQGLTLPSLKGITSDPIGATNGNVLYYDASSIQGTPKNLHLHLAVPSTKFQSSLSFDFSVSFHPGRVVNVHQSVTADGKVLTLRRVVVTSSETRFYVEGLTRQNLMPTKLFLSNLTVGNHVYSSDSGGVRNSDTRMINYDQPLFNEQGTWTLAIQEFIFLKDSSSGQFHRVPMKGANWMFRVTVPQI